MPIACHGVRICLAAATLFAGLTPVMASAESFAVSLAGATLGKVEYRDRTEGGAQREELTSVFDNTPLGVFNGTYAATSVTQGAASKHVSQTRSTRKSRDVSIDQQAGKVVSVSISPDSEQTELTQPARVPAGVLDPVAAFGSLVVTSACPGAMQVYDGRRVAQMTATGSTRDAGGVTCTYDYRVISGPGYLSPLGLSGFALTLVYDTSSPEDWVLDRIQARTGIFALSLVR